MLRPTDVEVLLGFGASEGPLSRQALAEVGSRFQSERELTWRDRSSSLPRFKVDGGGYLRWST